MQADKPEENRVSLVKTKQSVVIVSLIFKNVKLKITGEKKRDRKKLRVTTWGLMPTADVVTRLQPGELQIF